MMMPVNATPAVASTATMTITLRRRRSTSTPRCLAADSPSASRSSRGATSTAAATPQAVRIATTPTDSQVAPLRLPSCQNTSVTTSVRPLARAST
ncbi:Uncharacterised protein [Mycobacteroides abscessus subsp. abscessus]|nr:Uncharacterised protein [Mycobacteroides abscessus subsp. abscessus]